MTLSAPGAGGAPPRRSEHIGPHVEHRQQVITPAGIRHRDDHRFLCQIKPPERIERVEVGPDHRSILRSRICRDVCERVHRPAEALTWLAFVSCLRVRSMVTSEIEIEVSVHADGVRFLLGNGLCFAILVDRIKHAATSKEQRRMCGERMPTVFMPYSKKVQVTRQQFWLTLGDLRARAPLRSAPPPSRDQAGRSRAISDALLRPRRQLEC